MKLTARRGGTLAGTLSLPGDKSCSHRALILAAMASGTSRICGLLESDDVLATVRALEALGVEPRRVGAGEWRVSGGRWRSAEQAIDCANSATTARLLIGAIAGMPGVEAAMIGDRSLSRRPMARLVAPLRAAGADIEGEETLPLTVRGRRLAAIDHLNLPASAQVKTALLLAAVASGAAARIVEPHPSRDHGEIMLRQFGADLRTDGQTIQLPARQQLAATDIAIAGDPSSGAFAALGAAIIPGSRVRLEGMLVNPLRFGLFEALRRMGAEVTLAKPRTRSGESVTDIEIASVPLRPCQVAAGDIPAMIDEIPALAVACAFAPGTSRIDGLGELRRKESDRLAAIVDGLRACGVTGEVDGDALIVTGTGSVAGGCMVDSRGDHRIAMAFAILGLASDHPVEVIGAEMIATSYPDFAEQMRSLGADLSETP